MTLAELIEAANVGEDVDVSSHSAFYASVKFTHGNLGYTYVIDTQQNRYVFPMQGEWTVRFWKTLGGAKRYFLRMHGK